MSKPIEIEVIQRGRETWLHTVDTADRKMRRS